MIFPSVISTEFLKLRRCKVTWVTFGVYTIMTVISGFSMWILKNPGMAESLGLIGQKAQLAFGGQGAAWFGCLTFWLLPSAYVVGSMIGLSGAAVPLFHAAAWKLVGLYLMSLGSAMLAAWIAVETRGYFAPFGFAVFTLVLATTFGRTGWGPFIPWSVVGLYSGAAGSETPDLGWPSYAVVAVTFLIGASLTLHHEVYADNVQ